MKLIIDIPEEQFTTLNAKTQAEVKTAIDYALLAKAIKNGTPVSTEGDLISRSALRNEVDTWGCNDFDKYDFLEAIDNAPTVNTSKIEYKAYNEGFKDGVEQGIKLSKCRKGEWIRKGDSKWHCSKCGAVPEFDGTTNTDKFNVTMSNKYCRLCGADMRKGGAE